MQTIFMLGLIAVLIIFFVILMVKENESNKRFARYEKALEGLMQENFALKKQIEKFEFPISENMDQTIIETALTKKFNKMLDDRLNPIFGALTNMGNVIDEFANDQQSRLFNLEERTREINKITPNVQGEEEQIIKMFNDGKSIENIAKDMRIGVGRVELVLKLNSLV